MATDKNLTNKTGTTPFDKIDTVPSQYVTELTPDPSQFNQDALIPEEMSITYTPYSAQDQYVVCAGSAPSFRTDAYIENRFISKDALNADLAKFSADSKTTLDTVEKVRAATISLYPGLPSQVISFSDNGPAKMVLVTNNFPVVGISDDSSLTLSIAIENHQQKSTPTTGVNTYGRIVRLNSVSVSIPAGFAPSSSCTEWKFEGGKLSLTEAALEKIDGVPDDPSTSKMFALAEGKQYRLPDCKLDVSDASTILLKPDAKSLFPISLSIQPTAL